MRTLRTTLLAGVAAIATGFSGAALAQSPQTHVMTVQPPGGGIAEIRYTGNVAPQLSFGESPAPIDVFAPMPALFGASSPFAMLDRISAEMDREAHHSGASQPPRCRLDERPRVSALFRPRAGDSAGAALIALGGASAGLVAARER
jgi:hypothetical protein